MKALFYGFQYPHHGRFSAFNGFRGSLAQYGVEVVDTTWPRLLNAPGFRRYLRHWLKHQERRLWNRIERERYDLVHYFFPENSLFETALQRKTGQKLVLTLHLPGGREYLEHIRNVEPWLFEAISKADGLILMAPDDLEIYRQLAPGARVTFLPHGIDTEFFSPPRETTPAPRGYKTVLTVGRMLRDYPFWARTVQETLKITKNVRFVVIAGKQSLREALAVFGGSFPAEVQWLSGISDEDLRKHYADSDLVFLPLHQAWANNTLLEALAMGVPAFTTDLPATRAYLGDFGTFFQNTDAGLVANQLVELLNRDTTQPRQALRQVALNQYTWDVVARRNLEFYRELLEPATSQ